MSVKHKARKSETAWAPPHHDDLDATRLLLMLRGSRNCTRCGGLLVPDRLDSAADSIFEQQASALRCVQCGDILDRVILRNRLDPASAKQVKDADAVWDEQPAGASVSPEVVSA
ncbi:MAG TPA: hypothetical protein PLO50_00205 [Nitrospira sp.]|nr:hypothetical protein [Nitrospira sp.]